MYFSVSPASFAPPTLHWLCYFLQEKHAVFIGDKPLELFFTWSTTRYTLVSVSVSLFINPSCMCVWMCVRGCVRACVWCGVCVCEWQFWLLTERGTLTQAQSSLHLDTGSQKLVITTDRKSAGPNATVEWRYDEVSLLPAHALLTVSDVSTACVCVWKRERERERVCVCVTCIAYIVGSLVCVCVCVCVYDNRPTTCWVHSL